MRGRSSTRVSYHDTTAAQSVSSQVGARAWHAAIAACTTYLSGVVGVRRSASPSSETASAIWARSHRARSWSASSTTPSGPVRVRRRESSRRPSASRPMATGVVRLEPVEEAGQPDGLVDESLAHQVVARRGGVALVEHEVDGGQDPGPPVGQLVVRRHPVGDPGGRDLLAGAHEPLGHRRFGDQQRPGDLGDGEPAQGAEGERHLGLERQARVAAGEHQAQQVVVHDRGRDVVVLLGPVGLQVVQPCVCHRSHLLRASGDLAAQQVHRPAAGGQAQPRDGVVGHPVA